MDFINWFNHNYEKTDDNKNIINLKELYRNYQCDYMYENLTVKEIKKYKYSIFKKDIIKNTNLNIYIYERKKINGKDYRNVLTNYKESKNYTHLVIK